MTDCRLIIDPPAPGAWNMAVDEVLWDWSGRTGAWCLRMYRWAEPTLSLGYFQDYRQRWEHAASRSCAVVRRISGGGAILHDAEWTYSVAVPFEPPAAIGRPYGPDVGHASDLPVGCGHVGNMPHTWLYEAVHGTIIDLLAEFGVEACIQTADQAPEQHPPPFLCFQRRSPGDVLVGPVKVAGSAQRRSRAAVLQHGSLLLACSQAAPELPGLKELTGRDFVLEQVLEVWLERLSERLELRWVREDLSQEERQRASQLMAGKHLTEGWIARRSRPAIGNPLDMPPGPG